MPNGTFNGVKLYYEEEGSGDPLVLVHGSWIDHHSWDLVVPSFAKNFRVISYDRRGHSQSERPAGDGSLDEDVADLAAVIEKQGPAPAHIVANSRGAVIALRLAANRPELFRSLSAHEPPLFDLLEGDPALASFLAESRGKIAAVLKLLAEGELEDGARLFVDTILGPGAWKQLPPGDRQTFINNAPTFLDEERDPEVGTFDLSSLASFNRPALLTAGSDSPPLFGPVVAHITDAITGARHHIFEGAGHIPHTTHPQPYVDVVTSFVQAND